MGLTKERIIEKLTREVQANKRVRGFDAGKIRHYAEEAADAGHTLEMVMSDYRTAVSGGKATSPHGELLAGFITALY